MQLSGAAGRQALEQLYGSFANPDSLHKGIGVFDKLTAHYRQQSQSHMEQSAWLFGQLLRTHQAATMADKQKSLQKARKQAVANGWPVVEAELQLYQGLYFFEAGEKGPGFENMLRAFGNMERLGFDKHPWLAKYSVVLANSYFALGDMEGTVRYAPFFENAPDAWNKQSARFYFRNTIGLAYRDMERYDSAAWFFQEAYESARLASDSFWMALSLGNLAAVYYDEQRYAEAIPYLQTDFAASRRFGQWGSMLNAGLMLADCMVRTGRVNEARTIAAVIDSMAGKSTGANTLKLWYKLQFDLAKADGRMAEALRFADSALVYQSKVGSKRNADLINATRNKLEMEGYLHSIENLQQQKEKEILLRNALLAIILLSTVIAVLFINRSRLRRNKQLAEMAFEKRMADEKLHQLNHDLEQFTLRMKEKTLMLERFEQELNLLKQSGQAQASETDRAMEQMLQASILTEEEWQQFRELFEKVHPGFLSRLRMRLPDLTPAETRLLVLTKLQLSSKEMAAMLGIGYEAIKKTRQRLRKKIDLPENGGLEDLLEMI
ncbi:MAG: tetratricopeptide repeat protein [Chitinophagaceae bacterium]|jgi:DNA-binding CsgD family transcriptional regulator|nr:tetratricopeptide repeat protein [Chitinophagaceae bacterium]